jgi:hypothetical protein
MWLDCVRGKRCWHPFRCMSRTNLWFGAPTPNAGGCHVNNHLSHKNRPFNESGVSAGRCTASADSASSSSAESGLIPDEVGLHRVVGHHRLVEG